MKTAFLIVGLVIAAGPVAACRPSSGVCSKDSDCKGDRICAMGQCTDPAGQAPQPMAPTSPAKEQEPAATAPPSARQSGTRSENDGSDMRRPSLAPSDADFTDTRGGWGWGDRCWINLKKKKYGWAKAECDKAMAMNPKAPSPRASILYNLGLIEQGSGNLDAARTYYQQSLALREHPEVRAALESVAGSPNSQPGDDLGESVVLGPKGVCDLIYGGTDCVMFCETDGFCAQLLAKKQLGIGKCTLDPGLHKKRKTCGIKP